MRIPKDAPELRAGSIVRWEIPDAPSLPQWGAIVQRVTVGATLFVLVDTGSDPYIAVDRAFIREVIPPRLNMNFRNWAWRANLRHAILLHLATLALP